MNDEKKEERRRGFKRRLEYKQEQISDDVHLSWERMGLISGTRFWNWAIDERNGLDNLIFFCEMTAGLGENCELDVCKRACYRLCIDVKHVLGINSLIVSLSAWRSEKEKLAAGESVWLVHNASHRLWQEGGNDRHDHKMVSWSR